jgi:hypothetical protein
MMRSLAREVGDYGITPDRDNAGLTVTKAVKDGFPAAMLETHRNGWALTMLQAGTRLRLHERPRTPMTGEGQHEGT